MGKQIEFDTTVLGGFPVTVRAVVHPPEPDVGMFHPYAEVRDIRAIHQTDASFIARKLTHADWDKLGEQAVEEATRQEREEDR